MQFVSFLVKINRFNLLSTLIFVSGYFCDGQGISEATRFHIEKMELSGCTEADLADSTKNPKYRTVQHWFTEWRLKHQGPRTGDGVIDVSERFCIKICSSCL